MNLNRHWSLGAKLMLVGVPFLFLVLLATAATLWVSWQLDGGAAAVNEAGSMRMQSYRMSLAIGTQATDDLQHQAEHFRQSLQTLKRGDVDRPLFVPWDEVLTKRFALVEADWTSYQEHWINKSPNHFQLLTTETTAFVADIDSFVSAIEAHIARWTALLHLLQMSMLALVILAASILLYTGYLFVLEPVGQLKQAIEKVQRGDFTARVERSSSDEFGTLADGFNGMADHLQSLYKNLEAKVAEKTIQIQEKTERLESLYEITALVANATSLDTLAKQFTLGLARISRADGVALRWANQDNRRYLMLAAHGLPDSMVDAEQCISMGDCHCGSSTVQSALRVIPIRTSVQGTLHHCARAGFETVVTIPVRLHEKLMGEVDLFFHAQVTLLESERSLLEALSRHLAGGMENLRLNALEKEAAVSQERHLLARELHDSIAQSLAFLKIQVQLMRDAIKARNQTEVAKIVDEIDIGVRESYSDVRELLLHFRTRTNDEDIEPALLTTLQKFEHQSGIKSSLNLQGHGLPLSPDLQIQALHIIQEALSNVRKHARASQVWLDVKQQPRWRFEVRDDGIGFNTNNDALDQTHVGLRIMSERAQRIDADLEVVSTPGRGCSVILELPAPNYSSNRSVSSLAS
ncbi:MAG: type IV pili methyl-accepting chemotaxis transducer N-terminal domain-containing protein [Betaproteobacteria bacterium]|jgi:two-component system nitrate/nitrite sensor histidine kinase NarX|nr:type IV pili methyl-accepting chemotaxis transducer N-terminal domain-containing protein [Betaproteobacteria bacterium]MBP6645854.1 type IV pili methyl-accepting chemotaxis transducer N-terminal domain-containing protein [Burkholderiaceae bacterium]